ncbi:MAG TPA: hypothetical protein PLC87_11600, partial [Bacteroidales bacterium]|nr:hypothetical protein [Bacteroidales bacterium]HOL99106.1 hypothetical protein [Bacteroidales bacterium]HUM33571.1 hypothetical protein [Bacteroidales bacterium]
EYDFPNNNFPKTPNLKLTKTHMRRWLVGGLRSVVSEANETKQATYQPLTAICDVRAFFYFSVKLNKSSKIKNHF